MRYDKLPITMKRKYIVPDLPKNIDEQTAPHFKDTSYLTADKKPIELNDVFVTPDGLCLKNGLLVKGCVHDYPSIRRSFHLSALRGWVAARLTRRTRYTQFTGPTTYLLLHHPWFNYYHWVLDCLLRMMQVYERLSDVVLLLPESYKDVSYVMESLRYFSGLRIEYIPKGHSAMVSSAVIPQMQPIGRNFDPEELRRYRSLFVDEHVQQDVSRRIFVTRNNANKRRIINRKELMPILDEYGFEVVDFEKLSFQEQISLMQSTEYLIAGHGAGLANALFLKNGAKVFELAKKPTHREDFVNGLFFTLCSALSLPYYIQLCEPVNPDVYFVEADIRVQVESFKRNIELFFQQESS